MPLHFGFRPFRGTGSGTLAPKGAEGIWKVLLIPRRKRLG